MAAGLALLIALAAPAQDAQPRPEDVVIPPRFRPRMVGDVMQEPAGVRERRERLEAQARLAMSPERLESVQVGARVRSLAQGLEDPSFQVRERAGRDLLDPEIDDREIWALLDRGGLGDEAHDRLVRAAIRRALDKPRGALGVRMGNGPPERPGVLVQATIPGLPADKVLLSGDLIEQIDETPIRTTDELADVLQGHPPGAEVRIVVVRVERDAQGRPVPGPDGKPIERRREFRMNLGNAIELDRADAAAAAGWPPGLRGGNMSLDRRRAQALRIESRFARPLPQAVQVPPPQIESPTAAPAPEAGVQPGAGSEIRR